MTFQKYGLRETEGKTVHLKKKKHNKKIYSSWGKFNLIWHLLLITKNMEMTRKIAYVDINWK